MSITSRDFFALAEFRYQLRCFLTFSETTARAAGVEPQQHQLLLALAGAPADERPTIGYVSRRLQIKHHSAVELASRCARVGLVRRQAGEEDRRQVTLHLTPRGERLLAKLSLAHRTELRTAAPRLVRALKAILPRAPRR